MALADGLVTIYGVPAHPLLVHAVVVLLPLSAVCAIAVAVRPRWRQRYGWPVLALTAAAVGSVPLAQQAGEQLNDRLASLQNPLIQRHAALGDELLPYALGFGVAVVVLMVAGRLADRERAAEPEPTGATVNTTTVTSTIPTTWRRIATLVSLMVVVTAIGATVQTVRIGHSGSAAVYDGVGR
jgi:NADH:ubiquinone oxidoreductase subunit 6 (subunit J)